MSDELKEVICRVCQRNKMQISVKSTSGVCLECVSGGALVVPPESLKPIRKPRAKRGTVVKPVRTARKLLLPFGSLAAWVKAALVGGKGTKEILHAARAKWPEYDPKKLRSTVYTTKSRMRVKTEGVKISNEQGIQPSVPEAPKEENPVGVAEAKPEPSV